ncbi:MAG: 16S rRNA processing protein RimM [Rhodospirillales bacterium]|nr:16S rRNA processing protein RimM [Rhodospirillales bacterium]MDE2576765.1 16S rRNA processing protein RimM [Rhodospirillales bacterium]
MAGRRIEMGVIGRPHGVRGLVHLHSYAADPAALPGYGPFETEDGRRFTLRWVRTGVAELTELVDGDRHVVADRNAAERLVNVRLLVDRARLPAAGAEEFYLADLVGLAAFAPDGTPLGRVDTVHDYGAGASLEIGALLVPFTRACVPEVDIAAGRVVVVPPHEIVVAPAEAGQALEAGR